MVSEEKKVGPLPSIDEYQIQFSPLVSAQSADYKLFNLPDAVVQELKNGEPVCFKGAENDVAVMCTSTKTYNVKFTECSNQALVLHTNPVDDDVESGENDAENVDCLQSSAKRRRVIVGHFDGSYSATETQPTLSVLKACLTEKTYCGLSEDEYRPGKVYTFEELVNCVPCSVAQLQEALAHENAFLVNGCFRVMDRNFEKKLFDMILTSAVEHDWPLNKIALSDIVAALGDEYCPLGLTQCLKTYGKLREQEDESDVYELDKEMICVFRADELFTVSDQWKLNEFMDVWQECLPDDVVANVCMLKTRGLVLVETGGPEPTVRHFPVSSLPLDVSLRFKAVFTERSKWTFDDLTPFIRDLVTPKQSIEQLLLKFTRVTQPNASAPKMYSMRM